MAGAEPGGPGAGAGGRDVCVLLLLPLVLLLDVIVHVTNVNTVSVSLPTGHGSNAGDEGGFSCVGISPKRMVTFRRFCLLLMAASLGAGTAPGSLPPRRESPRALLCRCPSRAGVAFASPAHRARRKGPAQGILSHRVDEL